MAFRVQVLLLVIYYPLEGLFRCFPYAVLVNSREVFSPFLDKGNSKVLRTVEPIDDRSLRSPILLAIYLVLSHRSIGHVLTPCPVPGVGFPPFHMDGHVRLRRWTDAAAPAPLDNRFGVRRLHLGNNVATYRQIHHFIRDVSYEDLYIGG